MRTAENILGCCVPVQRYAWTAAAGFDYAELPAWQVAALDEGALAALLAQKAALGVPVLRLNAYSAGDPAIVGPAADDERTRTYASVLMKKAAALGVETIGVGAPKARTLPEGYDRAQAGSQFARFLRVTAEEAAPYGITLLIESIQKDMCNYLNTMVEARAMMERLALPGVRLLADLYHMETQGEDWRELGAYLPDVRHVHVSTVGPGLARGLYGAGDEDACFAAFRAIQAAGYSGTVSIEPDAGALTEEGMKTALRLMRRACGQI